MEKEIIKILSEFNSLTVNEIDKLLKINNLKKTKEILNNMVNNLDIISNKASRFVLIGNTKYKKGILKMTKAGYGFVKINDKDIFIHESDLSGAIDGDTVLVEINKKGNRPSGRIIKYKKRNKLVKVGEIKRKGNKINIIMDDKKFKYNINVENTNLVDGMKVVLQIDDMIDDNTYHAKIIEILGHKDDPYIDMISLIKEFGIEKTFPKEVIKEVSNINGYVTDEDISNILKKGGKDLRDEVIFTIDGDDTKDIDDAISVKLLPNGNYEVGVHIANVSHYVKPDSSIFKEACKRGTSVYIPGSNVPMLPRELSNGICSLNPNVDRLALSFVMEMDKLGNVVNFNVFESIIKSRIQMTYKNVNKILEENIIPDSYKPYERNLKILNVLAEKLRNKRQNEGCIDFDMKENKVILDKQGKAIDVVLRNRGEAEKLIEEFMIETGCRCSEFMDKYHEKDNGTHIYRNHDVPNEEKFEKFIKYLQSLGYKKYTKVLKELKPKEIQMLLDALKYKKEYVVLERELLKCMAKAEYSTNNSKHFALAKKSYCQTTSPIRRLGDLVNHTLIKENIYTGQKIKLELSSIADNASLTERNASRCEKEALKIKIAEYMENHIGEEYEGVITGMESYGLYVELPNLIEGLIPIKSLKSDNYEFNRDNMTYKGRTSKHMYCLGDRISIKVKSASKENRKIIFEVLDKMNYKVKKI